MDKKGNEKTHVKIRGLFSNTSVFSAYARALSFFVKLLFLLAAVFL